VTFSLKALNELPLPTERAGVADPYRALVPHSKWAVVGLRRGFTVPLRVTEVSVTADASPVLTTGGRPAAVAAFAGPSTPAATSPAKVTRAATVAAT
jgi:hypothetical protein